MKNGSQFSLSFKILDPLLQDILTSELGFKPTPRQLEYLEAIISKEDVLVVASTGSGKTFGTIVACLHRILREKPEPISTIVITPLKALNRDIFRRVLPALGKKLGISIAVRHGDTPTSERQKQTKNPPQILITTPELFQALLPAKIFGRVHLRNVQTVVVDEIHELVDNKRGIQLSLALERLNMRSMNEVQRIGLSATIGTPNKVIEFLAPRSTNRKIINIPIEKKVEISIEYPSQLSADLTTLPKTLHTTEEATTRFIRLVEIIKNEPGTVLLFTNTRQQAEILGYRFNRYNENVPSDEQIDFEVHHSSLSAQSRLQAETEVRKGSLDVVIATSSLELGIDIGTVSLVIQYMSPRRIETLIQRVGRAGHELGELSRGIVITETPRDLIESFLVKRKALSKEIESSIVHPFALDILFHGLIGILLDFGETSLQRILKIITGAFPYRNFTSKKLLPLLEFGRDNYFFFINKEPDTNKITLKAKRKAYRYYYTNLSSIPTKKTYSVYDVGRQKTVGQLDDKFVSTRGEKGAVFILNGLPWEFLAEREERIEVRQVKAKDATIPTWEGELIPVSQMVANSVMSLFSEDLHKIDEESPSVKKEILALIEDQKRLGIIPSKKEVYIETTGRQAVIHCFLGSKGNETFGLLLSSIIGAMQGHSVEYRADPYSVFFSIARPLKLKPIIESINPQHIKPLLEHRIKSSDLFKWRIRHVAKRFGVISESSENSFMMTKLIFSRYKDTIIGEETVNEIFAEDLNLNAVQEFFVKINNNSLIIEEIPVKNFDSPLSLAATQPISLNVLKIRPSHVILEKIEKRIQNTWVRLVCMRLDCKFEKTQRIQTLNENIQCPLCQSRFIAVVHRNRTGIKGLLKKSVNKKVKLTQEERKELNSAKKSADLILSFGKRAAFVLAGRGIGPTTAVRILRAPQKNTEDLLELIYRHEAEFARTREYWD